MTGTPHDDTAPPNETPAQQNARIGAGTWRELFGPAYRASAVVLAGGVAAYATNIYLTTSLLPNAVEDIGGEQYYAWAMTVFLLASVITSMFVGVSLRNSGPRRSYLIGFGVFAVGSLVCAAAPTMAVMLAGRAVQGLGGGLLTGLAFAVLRSALPERLWPRAVALISAMWGVGNILGPVLGGLFAQLGAWRGAFLLLAAFVAVLCVMSQRALPRRRPDEGGERAGVPTVGLVVLTGATAAVSIASIASSTAVIVALAAVGVAALAVFVAAERRTRVTVLPRFAYSLRSPLPWVYLGIVALAIGSTTETFVPLFGQHLGGMEPFVAGMLGAAISWGWSIASILSTYATAERSTTAIKIAGPLVLAAGLLGYGLLQADDPSGLTVTGWFITLAVAGAGIGMAFAHFITAAISSTDDEADAAKASAGVNTVQLISNTFGSALAGLLVAVGGPSLVGSARLLNFGFAGVAAVGVLFAVAAARRGRSAAGTAVG
ncbi:MFS transporter [Tomitella gaofuii]|uniref:MFS transporter n=1 Tax=Tomitella gaofuii TaxID=2760083 RepID=UPI0015FE156A|nr:MFS transporter [Tomitella gaofuii]